MRKSVPPSGIVGGRWTRVKEAVDCCRRGDVCAGDTLDSLVEISEMGSSLSSSPNEAAFWLVDGCRTTSARVAPNPPLEIDECGPLGLKGRARTELRRSILCYMEGFMHSETSILQQYKQLQVVSNLIPVSIHCRNCDHGVQSPLKSPDRSRGYRQ